MSYSSAFFPVWFAVKGKKKEKVSETELAYSFDLKGWIASHSATLNHSPLIPFFKQMPSSVVQLE